MLLSFAVLLNTESTLSFTLTELGAQCYLLNVEQANNFWPLPTLCFGWIQFISIPVNLINIYCNLVLEKNIKPISQ